MWRKRRLAWIGIGATAAMLALTGTASAISLTLTGPIQGNTLGPQSTSNPCIIAGTSCQQPATMGFNNFTSSGSITAYNMYSDGTPSGNNGTNVADSTAGVPYTVTQLRTAVGNLFEVAIDVNTTSAMGETLQSFQVIENATPSTCGANGCTTGTVLYDFTGPHLIGNIANNGNGFGDWSLGTINLASLMGSDTILFHAVWNNASDGAESFFLVPVPGPVVGAGLPGLVMACGGLITLARRRRKLVV